MANSKDVKVGDVVKISSNKFASYSYPKGTKVTVVYKNGNTINVEATDLAAISVSVTDVELIAQTKEEIQGEIKKLEAALKIRKDRLKWMEETNSEVYDESEFKVWQILGTLDSKSSKIDKARAIAAIVDK